LFRYDLPRKARCRKSPGGEFLFLAAKKRNQKKAAPASPPCGFPRLDEGLGRLRNSPSPLRGSELNQYSPTSPEPFAQSRRLRGGRANRRGGEVGRASISAAHCAGCMRRITPAANVPYVGLNIPWCRGRYVPTSLCRPPLHIALAEARSWSFLLSHPCVRVRAPRLA